MIQLIRFYFTYSDKFRSIVLKRTVHWTEHNAGWDRSWRSNECVCVCMCVHKHKTSLKFINTFFYFYCVKFVSKINSKLCAILFYSNTIFNPVQFIQFPFSCSIQLRVKQTKKRRIEKRIFNAHSAIYGRMVAFPIA